MEKTYTITLADETELTGLRLNGNNFISNEEIDESVFNNNLSSVIISDGENEKTHGQMVLVHLTKMDDEYWFILRDMTTEELNNLKNRSDIDYIAMMCNVELSEQPASHSVDDTKFNSINTYYNTVLGDQRIWTESRVRNAVQKGSITQQQYVQITGQSYT